MGALLCRLGDVKHWVHVADQGCWSEGWKGARSQQHACIRYICGMSSLQHPPALGFLAALAVRRTAAEALAARHGRCTPAGSWMHGPRCHRITILHAS